MQVGSGEILATAVIDKRETALKSPLMEKEGLKRVLRELDSKGAKVAEIVTDAHTQIACYLSKHN